MTNEEKNVLKERYYFYKKTYYDLKKNLASSKDPIERHEMLCELSALGMEVSKMRKALIDECFGKFYISNILNRFMFNDEERIGGR